MGEGSIRDYRDLEVWKEAMTLAAEVYEMTRTFPREEMFGMTSQLRRASVSIAANIAEGYGRQQTKPYVQFLRISQGSLKETETLILIAGRVGLWEAESSEQLYARCQRIGRMLVGLVRKLEPRKSPE
jgi:four helix bundle protein